MVNYGLENCVIPKERVYSNEFFDEILSGKRALIDSFSRMKSFLSKRVKTKDRCGFYLSESLYDRVPRYLLYNKKFNKEYKQKMDFK